MSNVIWITGLSASGKTTLAKSVTNSLKKSGHPVILLDGDILRECMGAKKMTSREDRRNLAYSYAKFARMLSQQGVIVVVGTIALFKEIHSWNRENIPGYFEVFLDVPLNVLKDRDPKDLYKRFERGEIKNIAGMDIAVDYPKNPDLHIKHDKTKSIEDLKNYILTNMKLNLEEF